MIGNIDYHRVSKAIVNERSGGWTPGVRRVVNVRVGTEVSSAAARRELENDRSSSSALCLNL